MLAVYISEVTLFIIEKVDVFSQPNFVQVAAKRLTYISNTIRAPRFSVHYIKTSSTVAYFYLEIL